MKIAIIGAGIAGMSFAKALSPGHLVHIYEAKNEAGGIARPELINGISYHPVGGHCFNSKHKEVLDFIFNRILPESEWHKVSRNAAIRFHGNTISYPIEFAVSEIASYNESLAIQIVTDFILSEPRENYENLDLWFRGKFGNTLAKEYFIPYNEKIWGRPPSEMSHAWVEGKLPIPNKDAFIRSLIKKTVDQMPHAEFFYPRSNSQLTFINALAKDLDIQYEKPVVDLLHTSNKKWVINQAEEYDVVVSTAPLKFLPRIIKNSPSAVIHAAEKLKYNKVSTMLWESGPTDKTWTYIPGKESIFHRYIHIGNFFKPQKNFTITESVGVKSWDEMEKFGREDPFLIKPLAHNVSECAYVVYDQNRDESIKVIDNFLLNRNIHSIGRFGRWDYFNMDICILGALNLAKKIDDSF